MPHRFWIICLAALVPPAVAAPIAERTAAVDPQGILRWQDDGSEVNLFGVNTYVPFSIDYQALQDRGLDHDRAILQDVEHFVRLGLTAIRLHCWDRELSDRDGNLRDNEHLRLLDLLISECKSRGIYSVMTPIAWWGGTRESGGFSDFYSMHEITTRPEAWQAQCNYLRQYMNHVNRYTGLAFKDEPAIVAVELINEPLYPEATPDETVTRYIDTLAEAVRGTGCDKPIFYNCWAGRTAAAAASTADGVSFNWYPTGLASGAMLEGDYLSRVNDYPAMRDEALATKAKIVYEFDAADVHGNVMYPAMARSFRSGGAQIATQFQYDVTGLADTNVNWQTHYLNLCYTPGKALSFAIAAEVSRRIPRLAQFGPYPDSTRFGDFELSYEHDRSELVTRDTFMYSNGSTNFLPDPDGLVRIAGRGPSVVVDYEGNGAYFLDRLSPGVWKLQLYPDVVMIRDPYSGGPLEKMRLMPGAWPLWLNIPDLGDNYRFVPVDADRAPLPDAAIANGGPVPPGEYVVLAAGATPPASLEGVRYSAPEVNGLPPAAFAQIPSRWREGRPLSVRATVAATPDADCVLHFSPAAGAAYRELPMVREAPYEYLADIPGELMVPGTARCTLSVRTAEGVIRFPGGHEGEATADELQQRDPVPVMLVTPEAELPRLSSDGVQGEGARAQIVHGREPGSYALSLSAPGFGEPPSSAGIDWPLATDPAAIADCNAVSFLVRGGPHTGAAEISLVQNDGNAFGTDVPLTENWRRLTLPLSQLRPMWSTKAQQPDLSKLDHITIVFGAWLYGDGREREHLVQVQEVSLSRRPDVWTVAIAAADSPIVIARPGEQQARVNGHNAQARRVPGMDEATDALRIHADGFGAPPDCASVRIPLADEAEGLGEQMARARSVLITARGTTPETTRLELVILERDGSPWGVMDLALTERWQSIAIPIEDLQFFAHWPHPEGRGGEGDRLRADEIQAVGFCIGSWQYGDEPTGPRGVEVQQVALSQE